MTEQHEFSDEEIVQMAENLSDERRLRLIWKVISMDTPQSRRVVEYLMAIHLGERSKARAAVDWAIGNTLH
jgi:hypothetical protein